MTRSASFLAAIAAFIASWANCVRKLCSPGAAGATASASLAILSARSRSPALSARRAASSCRVACASRSDCSVTVTEVRTPDDTVTLLLVLPSVG